MPIHIRLPCRIATLLALGLFLTSQTSPSGEPAPSERIDVSQFRLVFNEEFETLDVSANGPGTRWTAHTPWNGDFGDAVFTDPGPGFPFTVADGILRIEAKKDGTGQWRSGLLASANSTGIGFSRQYGYFELRARLPKGPGVWPAFWLASIADNAAPAGVEIDILEHYGHFPADFHSVMQVWFAGGRNRSENHIHPVRQDSLYEDFNTYGVLVEPEWTRFFFNRVEYWKVRTPMEHTRPLLVLLNLALGSGWPIVDTPEPSHMYVDYIKVYEK